MLTDEMTAWLGPAADELTEDQLARFARVWDQAETDYPGDDGVDDRTTVLSAAVQYLLGETTIEEAGRRRAASRAAARRASIAAQQIALMAIEDDMSESEAARWSTVSRMWLRKRLGK